jgi:hypothetical protein
MNPNELTTALEFIRKDLSLPESSLNRSEIPGLDELHQILTGTIGELLDKDFNRLLNILYRIDISESRVAKALHTEDPGNVASELARLVIERELQKVETRRSYTNRDFDF